MESLARFWNLVHYCMYELQLNFHKAFKFINPVYYLYKVPLIKKRFAKKYGTDDMAGYIDDAVFDNPENGQTIVWAGIHIGVLLISIEILLFNIIQVLSKKNLNDYIFANENYKFIVIITFLVLAGLINYALVFKNKKYLLYFDDFNKIPRRTIMVYSLLSLFGYISLVVLTIVSFSWFKYI